MSFSTRDILAGPDGPLKRAVQASYKPRQTAPVAVSGDADGEGTITALSVTMRLKTVSEANTFGLRAKLGRKKNQRETVRHALEPMRGILPAFPVVVMLTRIGRKMLDDDNLASAFKAVRDGVAQAMGRDDGDLSAFEWRYAQEVGAAGYAVRITIETKA